MSVSYFDLDYEDDESVLDDSVADPNYSGINKAFLELK
jgi:hypothetical protein